ncbi:GNAT family N-acetyltransferase [Planococcus shenhongbingii]|uniref:GNAT family protein n=1 Tax=Planococcus shenhongbingii TaxID=3058398 RepID=A0ABT8NE70_9BACL|nr:GNAT family protein [Planococcus sp. N017]MDN7246004.1 GNAT family protein [Planococcus sp. N017]
MEIKLEQLTGADSEALFEFEMKNRSFFEERIPSRGDEYYQRDVFERNHQILLKEHSAGDSVFYLIKNGEGSILGRLNLANIDQTNQSGYLGYRVGQSFVGHGIASRAVKILLQSADDINIQQIEAKTTTNNKASQKVLEKNGFKQIEVMDEEIILNGEHVKFVYYIWRKWNKHNQKNSSGFFD